MLNFDLADTAPCYLRIFTVNGGQLGISVGAVQRGKFPYVPVESFSLNGEYHEAEKGAKLRLANVRNGSLDNLTQQQMKRGATTLLSEGVFGVLDPGGDSRTIQFQVRAAGVL